VKRTQKAVLAGYKIKSGESFKTIECSILDLGDDIAYSTYDIEDALTAGILRINDFLYPSRPIVDSLTRVLSRMGLTCECIEECLREFAVESSRFVLDRSGGSQGELAHYASEVLFADGHIRSQFIQWWVRGLISKVEFNAHEECPALSSVALDRHSIDKVDGLKAFVYHVVTLSAPLQTNDFKGKRIVEGLFDDQKK
jgi:dGTPase